ncbi:MAG: long-chain fatty acid--CoA ligase [Gemmatimonadota bacterium]
MSAMMPYALTPTHFLERAADLFGRREVVTASGSTSVRHGWSEVAERARRASSVLADLGAEPGDRVATLAWNTHRHLELYFAVPAMGCVLHTVNLRLASGQVAEVLRHGGARILLADPEGARDADREGLRAAGIEHFVCLGQAGEAPDGWLAYEALLTEAPEASWEPVDEQKPAALCYTSGTTGEPKGVAYTHRAIALHTLAISLPDGFGISERDVVLPAVPMFHANAWGLPFAAAMAGAGLVLPGVHPDARRFADLLSAEGVTFAAGVPTVWMEVLAELRARPRSLHPELRIHAGGAPTPPSLIEAYRRELDVEILTGWGMTELTPVGMVTHPRAEMASWPEDEVLHVRTSQGTPLPFVEARVVRDDGTMAPADGETPGELEVRGPWVTAGYYRRAASDSFRDGWLRTGDVATRDAHGYFRLVDRTKDLIRSGGEWISSVRLEHALMGRPGVAEAVVVAVPDPKWQERPWAFVVLENGSDRDAGALLDPLRGAFPRWWLPDRIVLVDEIPRTSTGKFDKKVLRDRALRMTLDEAPSAGG